MKLPLDLLPPKFQNARNGFARRRRILEAFCMIDAGGQGNPEDYVFNDQVVTDRSANLEATKFVIAAIGEHRGYAAQIRKLFHQHCHFGGHENSMLAQHAGKGVTGKRPNLVNKPGALTYAERQDRLRSEATGRPRRLKRLPVSEHEKESKFLVLLRRYWVKEKWSLAKTFRRLCEEHYADVREELRPTYDTFCRISNEELIPKYNLLEERNGPVVHNANFAILSGTATDYTQGKIETVDVDAWTPKVGIRVKVKGRWKKIRVRVLFAVARNSRAVVGIEIVLTGEDAIAYRRCIASCFMDKSKLAQRLGLRSPEGLVHGNIDGVFFDNGAGPSGQNAVVVCAQMRLHLAISPPASGQSKGCVESLNGCMQNALLDLEAAHTRKNDPLSREERRKRLLTRGTSLGRFIYSAYEAVAAYNLTAHRPQLRSHKDFIEGEMSSPMKLFASQQLQRRGDARKQWSERELLARFIAWEPYTVRNGQVHFCGVRFSSDSLKAFAEEQTKHGRSLEVFVKRFTADPLYILWKREGEVVESLRVIDEDLRRVQNHTWQELSLTKQADAMLKLEGEVTKRKASDKLTVDQHNGVADAVRHRDANGDIHDIAGTSTANAKATAIIQNNRRWEEREAAAFGLAQRPVAPVPPEPSIGTKPPNAEYAAWLQARKVARENRKPEPEEQ
ncbi:hypothetical protein [Paraburkholderia ginsengisoli]|uniref:Integrase catalytic domain-containing protein n=1 Tax=Paraburkholderia ginsengisoli TaxID=311231 RepID=A0A7T4N0Y1_9BURK|nr:hypothetical protein [Paraburkholderia ginsengisoli]QQC63190.1 hypothetical protein I6I06_12855 [Paraburkholderia ginsengisoli]